MNPTDDPQHPERASSELEALARLLGGRDRAPQGSAPEGGAPGAPRPAEVERHAASHAEPGDLIAGRFEVVGAEDTRFEGGERLRCRDLVHDGREVRVDLLPRDPDVDPKAVLEGFETLVERLRAFPPEALVALLEVGRTRDGRVFLVADATETKSLRALVADGSRVPPRTAFDLADRLLATLSVGHRRGLPHGALDADAVRVEAQLPDEGAGGLAFRVRLADFGLASTLAELREPEGVPGAAGDLRAVGRLLVGLLTGTPAAVDGSEPTAPREALAATTLGAPARDLLERALASGEGSGFANADQMREAIRALPELAEAPVGSRDRTGWLVAATLGVLLIVALATRPPAVRTEQESGPSESDPLVDARTAPESVSRARFEEEERARQRAEEERDLLTLRLGQFEADNAELSILRDGLIAERDNLRTRVDELERESAEAPEVEAPAEGTSAPPGPLELASETSSHPALDAALGAPLALDPETARDVAANAAPEDVLLALEAFRATAVPLLLSRNDTVLDRARLHAIPSLTIWGEVARTHAVDPTLQLLALAHRYYERGTTLITPSAVEVELARDGAGPTAPWRSLLAASLALEAGNVAGPLGVRTYWVGRSPSGELSWTVRTTRAQTEPANGADRAWHVDESIFDVAGEYLGDRTFQLVQRGRRYEEVDARPVPWVDLGDASLALERSGSRIPDEVVLDNLPAVFELRPEDVRAFRARLVGAEAIVRREGEQSWWFVPGMGSVRTSDPDLLDRELVFVERP